ncbi:hypothetical protein ABH935_006404 [Catenulispora sp. GAS73]|uniref:sulfotransferase-like domain-containing protein n=1 Tax=Catenulispora sp. GAS73 TaxID=3156269 RepID=UPI003516289F
MAVIAMWAHSRSTSTAFLRMMIERGDVVVVHEPWLEFTDTGRVELPGADGRQAVATSDQELIDHLTALGANSTVFVKEVLDHRYPGVFENPARLAPFVHVFIAREPRQTIASHYAMKPTVTRPEIGFERLYELFELLRGVCDRQPLVLRSERLLTDTETAVRTFCRYTGLPYLPRAMSWQPQERAEWQRHRAWHIDAINSSGFADRGNDYEVTVDNSPLLKDFYDHHRPFYEKLVEHAD